MYNKQMLITLVYGHADFHGSKLQYCKYSVRAECCGVHRGQGGQRAWSHTKNILQQVKKYFQIKKLIFFVRMIVYYDN